MLYSKFFEYTLPEPTLDITVNYGLILFIYVAISIPNFLNTYYYLHNKQIQLLKLYADKYAGRDTVTHHSDN